MKKRNKITGKLPVAAWTFLMFMAVYCELLLQVWTSDSISPAALGQTLLFAAAFGALLGFIACLFPKKVNKVLAVIFGVLIAVLYLVEYFIHDAFQMFFTVQTMMAGAGGVADTFLNTVVSLLVNSLWRIGLVLLPIVLYAVFAKPVKIYGISKFLLALIALLTYVLSFAVVFITGSLSGMQETYSFDNAVRSYGLPVALVLDVFNLNNEEEDLDFVISEETEAPTTEAVETTAPAMDGTQSTDIQQEETEPAETEPVYEPHTLGLDFGELAKSASNANIKSLDNYVNSLTPAMENAYTGLFEGKNLIFITAEAFTGTFIDPELTPTLYRLTTEGIQFTDYYQPAWGASTTGGEYANVVGLMPTNGKCMQEAVQQDLFLTMGNQLQALGYSSAAFHNNSYTYYDRDSTHTHLGYDFFMGYGNGMENGVKKQWPQSDVELINYSLPLYIDQQPFSVYYMSVSGHSNYSQKANAMSNKNYSRVADLDYSYTIKCYIACQLELEDALTSLLAQLEAAGIMDDTVIVISSDHYPYGLEASSTWGTDRNYLHELFGENAKSEFVRDQNTLVIWSGCIEDMDIVVDVPVMSLDILPTLSNLFGLEYDSRLMAGRDVFSDEEALVFWGDYSWKTDKGTYDAGRSKFTPADGVEVDKSYVSDINNMVKNKIKFSKGVASYNYYNHVAKALEEVRSQTSAVG